VWGLSSPVYSFTASDAKDDLDELKSAGSDGVLEKPVNRQKLYEVVGRYLNRTDSQQKSGNSDDDDELRPIIDQFVASLPDRVTQLKQFSEQNQWQEVQKIAHQIKGIAGSLGYPELTEKAKLLDVAIKKEQKDDYPTLLAGVLKQCQQAIDTVEEA